MKNPTHVLLSKGESGYPWATITYDINVMSKTNFLELYKDNSINEDLKYSFIIKNKNKFSYEDWDNITLLVLEKIKISNNNIKAMRDVINGNISMDDWEKIPAKDKQCMIYNKPVYDFIDTFKDYLNWHIISKSLIIDQTFIRIHKDNIYWKYISEREDFINFSDDFKSQFNKELTKKYAY